MQRNEVAEVMKQATEPAARPAAVVPSADQTRLTGAILVVEDDPAIADVLEEVLRDFGYDVRIASTGAEALPAMLDRRPDLVLMDLTLPDMDGLELTRQLRADPRWNSIPVIALTARDRIDDRVVGLREGLDDYLTKPFNIAELIARLDANLRRSLRELHVSPLTLLPGNRAIEMAVARRLTAGQDFAVCYLDINNFKPYNDTYGFAAGDQIIRSLADVIQRESATTRDGFPGHVGGDDFVVVLAPDEAEPFCKRVLRAFDELVRRSYKPEDLARGSVESEDRAGNKKTFALMGLSIAVVVQTDRHFSHIGELSRAAAEIKSYLKRRGGSHYMIDRRGGAPGSERPTG